VVAVVVVAGLLLGGATPALASWYAVQSGPGTGGASAGSVLQAATPTVSVSGKNTVAVSWSASTLSTGGAVDGYTVSRYSSSGALATVQNGCAGALTSTSCTETGVPDGTWTYTVAGRFHNWTGPQSAKSASVLTDTTPPVSHFGLTSVSGGASLSGTTLYFRGAAAGSFRIVNSLTDAGSGPGGSTDGSISGGGWSNSPAAVTSPAGGPFVTNAYTWTAGTTTQPLDGIYAYDNVGNSVADNIQFTRDDDAPTGGAISYADGVSSSKTIPVTLAAVTDAGSGVASRLLQQAQAPLSSAGACGAFGAFTTVVASPASTQSVTVTAGSCYTFRSVAADSVGNQLITTSASVVQVPTYANTVLSTASLVSQWRLDDAAGSTTIADTGPAANTGTWSGSPALGAAGAIAGDGDTAVQFDGVDDVGRVARQISDDFTVELWMKSTKGAGTGTSWFSGAGLVDADVAGVNTDFGLSLLANGRIAVGTGSPDTSALSTGSYIDGAWHHVVMTRVKSTGVMTLFVDGAQVAQATGGTQSLTGSGTVSFGRVQTGAFFTGSLDEIAFYSAALTPAQVLAHYRAGSP
jgi:hypothetical protein